MKLVVFHHNGQQAVYPLDSVHSIEIRPENAAEEPSRQAIKINTAVADLLNDSSATVLRDHQVNPVTTTAPGEVTINGAADDPAPKKAAVKK